jgi:Holliday junction resolvase RusA-like endonuclease
MTKSDAWKKRPCVVKYWAYKAKLQGMVEWRLIDVCEYYFIFHLKMPNSWSEGKKLNMDGQPHKSRPDLDNLHKGLLDAIYKEDGHVWKIASEKVWARKSSIEVVPTRKVMLNRYANFATSI